MKKITSDSLTFNLILGGLKQYLHGDLIERLPITVPAMSDTPETCYVLIDGTLYYWETKPQ